MPKQAQLAARIDARVRRAVGDVCRARGVKINRFIEDALIDKLEELGDAGEVGRLRKLPTRPLADVIKSLGLDGEI